MKATPYIRPQLLATAGGRLPWQEEIRNWLLQVEELLAGAPFLGREERAFALVALRGKLWRVEPAHLAALDSRGVRSRLEQLVAADEADLLECALTWFDAPRWREDVRLLDEAQDHGLDAVESARWAGVLLEKIDHAELIWHAARRAGREPAGLRPELDHCVEWLVENADALLAAGVLVQAVAFSLRENLSGVDVDLAATARKLILLLDRLEELEEDAQPAPLWLEVGEAELVRLSFPAAAPTMTPDGSIPELRRLKLAASQGEEVPPTPPYRWRSQEGSGAARLNIPQKPPANGQLYLEFDNPKVKGWLVMLGGLRGEVNGDGLAAFAWNELQAVEPFLHVLYVGPDRSWLLLPR